MEGFGDDTFADFDKQSDDAFADFDKQSDDAFADFDKQSDIAFADFDKQSDIAFADKIKDSQKELYSAADIQDTALSQETINVNQTLDYNDMQYVQKLLNKTSNPHDKGTKIMLQNIIAIKKQYGAKKANEILQGYIQKYPDKLKGLND